MATYTKLPLSASVNGRRILITATTSGSATPIHTAPPSGSSITDEVWLYAYNESTASLLCSVLWGGTTEPNDVIRSTLLSQNGITLLVDGHIIQNGLTISAYTNTGSYVTVGGFINRIQ